MVFSDLGDQGTAGHARKLVAANPRPFKPGELNEAPGILGGVRKIGIHLATALMLAGRAIAAALTYGALPRMSPCRSRQTFTSVLERPESCSNDLH